MSDPRTPPAGPRVILEEEAPSRPDERLDLRWEQAVVPVAEPRTGGWSSLSLAATGAASLILGLSMLDAANFVASQFERGPVLGGLTLLLSLIHI